MLSLQLKCKISVINCPASVSSDLIASIEVLPRRRKIRLIESNAKCRYLKQFTFKGTLQQVIICPEAPSPPRFLFGVD
jgi:hypothetical protein